MFQITTIAVILFITTAINFIAAVISWQRRKSRTGSYLAWGLTAVTGWTLAASFDYTAVQIPLKVFFAKWEYTGYNLAFLFLIFFSLTFAGFDRWLKKISIRVLLGIVVSSNVLLAWTNDWHGWLWSRFTRSDFGNNTVVFEHGPGYLWAAVTGYLMITIIIIPFWLAMRRGSGILRKQARILFVATLVPILANLAYIFEPVELKGVEWTLVTFSITSLLFVYALYGMRLVDLVPIARDKVVAGMNDGMIVLDMQDRIIDINQASAEMLASSPNNLIGKNILDIIPSARPLKEQPIEKDIRTEFALGDTNKRYFDVLISPLFENRTAIIGRLIIFRDITDRKENELRLLQLTQAVEQSPASVVITDLEGNITYVNPQFSKLTGYTFDEAVGENPRILQSGHTPVETYQDMWRTIKSGEAWRGEFLNRKKNGDMYWEDAILAPVLGQDGQLINFIAVKTNITKRKKLEAERENLIEELKRLNAESESLRETAVIVTSTLEISDVVQRVLQQLRRVIEYDSAAVWLREGNTVRLAGGDGIADNIPEHEKNYIVNEENPEYVLWSQNLPYVVHDDVQVDYAVFREPHVNYIHGWMAIPLRVRERLIGFISIDSRNAGQFTHHDAQLALTYANQVSIALENARLFSNLQDELYQRQELITKLDAKNADLERFTYAVSHDLKSPLITAKWFLGYLKDDIASNDGRRVETDIQRMSDAMDIMERRVGGILDIARAGWLSDVEEKIDLNELVAEAVELVHGRISQSGIMVRVEKNLPRIKGNRLRLLDVFQNLIDNAAKFIGDEPAPCIEVGHQGEGDENPTLFVKDNGMGISPEQHDRIFGIFNKLNPKTEGTGIGLSLVKKIIETHGGRIWIKSEPGKGSTFYFTLPRG